jgi:glutamate/tyrosine decarboxylase-like PLP-dependent enzyme
VSADRDETEAAARLASERALAFLAELDERPVLPEGADEAVGRFGGPLPEEGVGALAAVEELAAATDAATASPGPRFFHFVTGGVTPAALGADWLASALDQNAFSWVGSPLGTRLETVAIAWLKDLFGLPAEWGGALTTGATGANLAGLGAARQWWGEQHGRDVGAEGLAGLPAVPVLSSGFVHPSATKALAILGLGRRLVRTYSRDAVGRIDLHALATALRELDGAPAIVIGNAGEVNAGEFDPIAELADLAEEHGAWLHVDGAFGLFARVSPRVAALADGVERAHSVIADGHKWLNVPYDCGFAFVRDPGLLAKVFTLSAAYLPADEPEPTYGYLVAESSQRARSLAVWAALRPTSSASPTSPSLSSASATALPASRTRS